MSLAINVINGNAINYTVLNENDLSSSCTPMNCGFKVFKVLETGSQLVAGLCATVGTFALVAAAPTAATAGSLSLEFPLVISKQLGIFGGYCLASAASLILISKLMQKTTQCFDTRSKTEITAASTKWNVTTCEFSANLSIAIASMASVVGACGLFPGSLMMPFVYMRVCSGDCQTVSLGLLVTGLTFYGAAVALLPVWKAALVCKNYFEE